MGKLIFQIKARIKKVYEIKEYILDLSRYHRHANFGFNSAKSESTQLSMIAKYYHIIEKGLTMPETRFGFGVVVLERIITYCNKYISMGYDINKLEFQHALNVLTEYKSYHNKNNFKIDSDVDNQLENLFERVENRTKTCGQFESSRDEFFKYSHASFEEFAFNRHTLRNYSEKNIDIDVILKCIKIAQKSPSACNRQPNRVLIINDKKKISEVLQLQSGNRGFGHLSNKLLVLTSDITAFARSQEKFGPHFNSGMFAMSLIYALHYNKIGSCCLNWSTPYEKDKSLRKLLNVPDNEYITLVISCGYAPDHIRYAASPRRSIKEVYEIF